MMSNLPICRICLRTNGKLYQYDRFRLKFFYEQVMALKVNELDGLPRFFCMECATMLHKFHKFKEKCYNGQKTLKEIVWRGSITIDSVNKVEKIDKNLQSDLQFMALTEHVKTYTITCKTEPNQMRIKPVSESSLDLEKFKYQHSSNLDLNPSERFLSEEQCNGNLIIIENEKKVKRTNTALKLATVKSKLSWNLRDSSSKNDNCEHNCDSAVESSVIKYFDNDNEIIFDPVDNEEDVVMVLDNMPAFDSVNEKNDLDNESLAVFDEKDSLGRAKISNVDGKNSINNEKVTFDNMDISSLHCSLTENNISNFVKTDNVSADIQVVDLDVASLSDTKMIVKNNIAGQNKTNNDIKTIKKKACLKISTFKNGEKAKNTLINKEKVVTPLENRFKAHKKTKNFLDDTYWLKINLNQEEAMEEFKRRALEKRYTTLPFTCEDCLKGFSTKEIVDRHIKLRHAEALGPFECHFCRMRFKRACFLRLHIREHYAKYKCLRCDLVCCREKTALFHQENHDGVIRKCPHCGIEFKHITTYYTHLRTHRSDFVCSLCGQSFVSQTGLKLHRKLKHLNVEAETPEVDNTYCEKCDIKFENREAYQEHLDQSTKHIEDLGTDIPTTNKKFTKGREMKQNPRKSRTCNHCGKYFGTQRAYLKHHIVEHPNISCHEPGDRQICEICGASLLPTSMMSHMNTHTRKKLHTCPTCGRQFNTSIILKNHLLTHTGEKPWPCSLCDKRFTQKGSMQLHYRTFHLKQPYPKRNRRKKDDIKISNEEDSDDLFLSKWRL